MIKYRLYFDKDKETNWLNEMAREGYELKRFFMGVYHFKKGEPGRYCYQIDFARGFCSVNKEYRGFMEEQNVEIVTCWGPWVILRKEAIGGEFQLYSDQESKIEHYSKICIMFKAVAILEILILLFETILMGDNFQAAGFAAIVILALAALGFSHMALRTSRMIERLKEENGQGSGKQCGAAHPSPILVTGLGLNAIVLCLSEQISDPIRITCQVIAIILMLAGIWKTARSA